MSFEVNLLAKRARLKVDRRVTIKEEQSSSSYDFKLDNLVRTMEKMTKTISIANITPPIENQGGPQIRNPNFRKNQLTLKKESREEKIINNRLELHFKKTMHMRKLTYLKILRKIK